MSASDPSPERRAPKAAAFFDVDGTLLAVQSGMLYIGYLRRRGLMHVSDRLRIYWAFMTYRVGMLNIEKLAGVTSRWLCGREEREVAEHCRDWYESEVKRHLRREIVDVVEAHRAAGHVVALLTGGTHYLNDLIAADVGIEHVLASRLEVVDGRFTGRADGPLCYGSGKILHAERFAAEHGVSLEHSYFYTDSITDVPLLERVGYPRVVTPDPRLRIEARQRGWTILEAATTRGGGARPLMEGERPAP